MKTNVWRSEMGSRDVAAVLGGRKVLGKKVSGAMDLARLVERGFPERVLDRVKSAPGLTHRGASPPPRATACTGSLGCSHWRRRSWKARMPHASGSGSPRPAWETGSLSN